MFIHLCSRKLLQLSEWPRIHHNLGQDCIVETSLRAIFVGLKVDQENLCDYLSDHKISLKPLLDDRIFSFEDSQGAFDYLYSGQHTGKVVIKL